MIPNTPSLCNNIMSRASLNIKDAHSQKYKRKIKIDIDPVETSETSNSKSTTSDDDI
jgi:hypothetical protein